MKTFFLDCEASSLSQNSYPIEIAWVGMDGQGESYLIKPEPDWTDWSPVAERLHGIRRATLEAKGTPVGQVAKRMIAALAGTRVVSDNPEFEHFWVVRLLAATTIAGFEDFTISHCKTLQTEQIKRIAETVTADPATPAYHRAMRTALDKAQMLVNSVVEAEQAKGRHKHRALPDATNLWLIHQATVAAMDAALRA
jgi:hypothetical protein